MYQPLSLSRVLTTTRNAKGYPPPSVVSSGVACLNPQTMQRENHHVLSFLKIEAIPSGKVTFVRAWPLDCVMEGFAALDDLSIASLGFQDDELCTMPSSFQSPRSVKKKSKKKSTPRGRRSSQAEETYTSPKNGFSPMDEQSCSPFGKHEPLDPGTSPGRGNTPVVNILLVDVIEDAEQVHLSADVDYDFIFSDLYLSMISKELLGRVLSPGMVLSTTAMGKHVDLVVDSIWSLGHEKEMTLPLHYTKRSKLDIVPVKSKGTQEGKQWMPHIGKVAGGLDRERKELREIITAAVRQGSDLNIVDAKNASPSLSNYHTPVGALLYGPTGTGKTLVACSMAEELSLHIEVVCGPELLGSFTTDSVEALKAAFSRARSRKPSLVLLDEIDAICPRRDAPNTDPVQRKLTGTLLGLLDGPRDTKFENIFVIGTTSRPDALDPALRRAGRFEREIEIPIPGASGRMEVLKSITAVAAAGQKLNVSDVELEQIASSCYGFVGADLAALFRESVAIALQRDENPQVCVADFYAALKTVRPSGLREIAVEIPFTKWDDIGGMDHAKRRLQEAVEWPLTKKGATLFASIGITPPRGILLYGPPGCSKTLLARAVATESGANFISVKGAELLSKWVGESEKAVRNIFRRARQAAPCVIFFDEIDALASSRSQTMGASAQARVVAQLLAEMDGIDTPGLKGRVVVIAATNRPDCLDAAFLRPGRMDVQIYVRLPNEAERLLILNVHTRNTPLADGVDLEHLASDSCTFWFSGAEIAALVREAALAAMEKDVTGAHCVTEADFETALRECKPRTRPELIHFFDRYSSQLEAKG